MVKEANDPGYYDFKKSLKPNGDGSFKYIKVATYGFRPIASLIVRLVYHTSITPNQLTFASFCFGLAAGLCFLGGRQPFFTVGGLCILLSFTLDCADGMLARARGQSSRFGAYLDLLLDRLVEFLFFSGMALGAFFHFKSTLLLVLGLMSIALYFLQLTLFYLIKNFLDDSRTGESADIKGLATLFLFFLILFSRMDIIIYLGLTGTSLSVIFKTIYFCRLGKR